MNQVLGSRMEPGYVPTAAVAQSPVAESPAGVAGLAADRSAVSWPAILAGAFVTVSASLILIVLGSGLGFAAVSPWPGRGASPAGLTVAAAIWLIVTQWISAALGGYIAGRLRTKWTGTHTQEVFFRDTAHGLITWSVATVFIAWVIAGSAGAGISGAADNASVAREAAIYTALSLLIGAFIASVSAAHGGRLRDEHV
jgi:hypothetical protein